MSTYKRRDGLAFSLIRRKLLKTVALSPFVYTGNTIADDSRHPGATATAKSVHSPFENLEKKIRTPLQTEALTPLHQLHGTITPADLHYQRHHSGVPDINPDQYRLLIHGLVDKSLQFTLQELKRFPAVSRIAFLECSGNCDDYFTNSPQSSPQDIAGLTSQSEWVGVSLATLLRETGSK